MVGLGQPEATDPFTRGQFGQVLLFLRLGTKLIDRHHDQGRLHTHHRAIAGVDTLDLTRNQTVADVVQTTATVLLRDHRPQQTGLAHLTENSGVCLFMTEGFEHAGSQLVLSKLLGAVTHHALFFGELLIQQQWIDPVEACLASHE